MFKDLLSSRLIQAGLALFVFCVGGSLLYSRHIQRTMEKERTRSSRFLQALEKQNETRPAEAVNNLAGPEVSGHIDTSDNNTDTSMLDAIEALPNETRNLDRANAFLPDGEVTLEEITAEEEAAEEALSAKELRNKEGKERLQNVYSKMRALLEREGGKVDQSSSLNARVEMFHLQQELFRLIEEGADDIPAPLRFFMNLSVRMGNATNAAGEFPVSEYVNIADYMESEGDIETATRMRAVAQRALDNGDNIIKSEHFKVNP